MSKPKKLRLKDFIYKPLAITVIAVVLLQTSIVLMFLRGYNTDVSINLEDCYFSSIIVEEKNYIKGHKKIRDSLFEVVSEGESYTFSATKYRESDLNRMISVGETIDIHYIDSGGYFFVVNAKGQNDVYVDINEYNRQSKLSNVLLIIIFSIIEIIFLITSVFYIRSLEIFGETKKFYKALKKKINKLKKVNYE